MAEKSTLVYFLGKTMYINVTNLCTCNCVFCVRDLNDTVAGENLWLKDENVTAEQVIEEIQANSPEACAEIVFCGYGEPLIKLAIVLEVAEFIKKNYPKVPVRVNTNGQASLIHKRNVVPELAKVIDKVSVSLNAENAEQYKKITQCKMNKDECFEAVKTFIKECVENNIDTTATVVSGYKDYIVDIEKCKEITESLGAKFRVREWLEEGYN